MIPLLTVSFDIDSEIDHFLILKNLLSWNNLTINLLNCNSQIRCSLYTFETGRIYSTSALVLSSLLSLLSFLQSHLYSVAPLEMSNRGVLRSRQYSIYKDCFYLVLEKYPTIPWYGYIRC